MNKFFKSFKLKLVYQLIFLFFSYFFFSLFYYVIEKEAAQKVEIKSLLELNSNYSVRWTNVHNDIKLIHSKNGSIIFDRTYVKDIDLSSISFPFSAKVGNKEIVINNLQYGKHTEKSLKNLFSVENSRFLNLKKWSVIIYETVVGRSFYLLTGIILLILFHFRFFLQIKSDLFFRKINSLRLVEKIISFWKKNTKYDLIVLSFIVISVCIFLFHKFIFGEYVFMFHERDFGSDTILNNYAVMYDIFKTKNGFSWWDFKNGLGNNNFNLFLTFVLDPFVLITMFFWDNFENGLVYVHILKLLCISLVFYKFIFLLTGSRISSFIVAVLVAFNGYVMLLGQHYFFVNKLLYFVILLYAIENFYRNDKRLLLYLAFVLNLTDIYFFYQSVFFVGIYLIFRNIYMENTIKGFRLQFFQIVKIGVVSLFISSVFILPYLNMLSNSPRINPENLSLGAMAQKFFSLQTKEYYLALCSRFFSNNLSGNGINHFGYVNYYMSPQMYSGLITLLILPQALYLKKRHEKRAIFLLIITVFISLAFPLFSYFLNAFQELYYRWTYVVIVFNLIAVSIVLKSIIVEGVLNVKAFKATFLVLLTALLLFLIYYKAHDGEWRYTALSGGFYAEKYQYIKKQLIYIFSFLFLYGFLLIFIKRYLYVSFFLLVGLICIEMVVENYATQNFRGLIAKNRNPYNNSSLEAVKYLKSIDNSSIYRIEKQYFSFYNSSNDAMVHDYYGLKSYQSTNHRSYVEFCRFFNLIKKDHWINVLPGYDAKLNRNDLYNLLSVKYLFSKTEINDPSYFLIANRGDILIYKNLRCIPFGSTFTKYITKSSMEKLPEFKKDNLINKKIVIEDKDEHKIKSFLSSESNKKQSVFKIHTFKGDFIDGEINAKSNSMLFYSIPFDEGWEIKVDNKKCSYYKINIGFIGIPLKKGHHKIELSFVPPFLKLGVIISLTSLILTILFFRFKTHRKK
jgi:uncharacterized membrane protein YfhO